MVRPGVCSPSKGAAMLSLLLSFLTAMEFKATGGSLQLCPSGGRTLEGGGLPHFSAEETE